MSLLIMHLYYYTDLGLRNARLNYRQHDPGHIMENIIYNEKEDAELCSLKLTGDFLLHDVELF